MMMAEATAKQAHIWKRDEHDWYVEPEWCSRRLFECERFDHDLIDPACGSGTICHAAAEAGLNVVGTDIVQRWPDGGAASVSQGLRPSLIVADFLADRWGGVSWWARPANIVSNPPYKLAQRFVDLALERAARKIAMLLPITWLNGAKRSAWLETTPLRRVWILAPRPSMPPGTVIQAGEKPGGGTVDFAWFVWLQGYDGRPEVRWLRRAA